MFWYHNKKLLESSVYFCVFVFKFKHAVLYHEICRSICVMICRSWCSAENEFEFGLEYYPRSSEGVSICSAEGMLVAADIYVIYMLRYKKLDILFFKLHGTSRKRNQILLAYFPLNQSIKDFRI